MLKEWTIIKNDENAKHEKTVCFYCKRFFCTGYIHPRCRMLCSGILPQWEFLYFLMRNVRATDTCKKFMIHEAFKQKTK